jgi:hypothetical protein
MTTCIVTERGESCLGANPDHPDRRRSNGSGNLGTNFLPEAKLYVALCCQRFSDVNRKVTEMLAKFNLCLHAFNIAKAWPKGPGVNVSTAKQQAGDSGLPFQTYVIKRVTPDVVHTCRIFDIERLPYPGRVHGESAYYVDGGVEL